MCVYVSSLSGTHIWQAETEVLSVPVSLSLPYSFEDGSLWTRTSASGKSGWLVSPADLPISASQCWDCRRMQLCPHFMWVTGVLNSSPHDCKASNLTKWAISPSPKDIFFFKSLYWLRVKWGLDRELKYLWGKILQTYLCLYFFTTSYSPLPGKSHPRSNFNACTPRSQYPQISWKTLWKITDREIISCHSFGVSTQEENFLLSCDCSVLWHSGVDWFKPSTVLEGPVPGYSTSSSVTPATQRHNEIVTCQSRVCSCKSDELCLLPLGLTPIHKSRKALD